VKVFLGRPINGERQYLLIDATDLAVKRGGRIFCFATRNYSVLLIHAEAKPYAATRLLFRKSEIGIGLEIRNPWAKVTPRFFSAARMSG
jgi:hypothetical protein